jgi:hypothetical protein
MVCKWVIVCNKPVNDCIQYLRIDQYTQTIHDYIIIETSGEYIRFGGFGGGPELFPVQD